MQNICYSFFLFLFKYYRWDYDKKLTKEQVVLILWEPFYINTLKSIANDKTDCNLRAANDHVPIKLRRSS